MMSDIVACLTTSPFQGLKNKGIREKKIIPNFDYIATVREEQNGYFCFYFF